VGSLASAMPSRLPEQCAGYRIGLISGLAALIGILAGFIAYALYDLIGLITNLAYYHEWSFHFRSPEHTQLGPWIIVTPVIGGIIVGFMAKYGSEKIKGHGIPEAMEAVLCRDRHRNRRTLRSGRSHHSNRRRGGLFDRANHFDYGFGAQGSSGLRRGSRHGRYIQHANRGGDSCHRASPV
jgi:hypothetical protein